MVTPTSGKVKDNAVTELEARLEKMSLQDKQAAKEKLKKHPFLAVMSILCYDIQEAGLSEDQAKPFLNVMHKTLLDFLGTSLTPNQLLFSFWFSCTIAAGDPHVELFQNICLFAAKVLRDDLSSQSFCPEMPQAEWIEPFREKLKEAKNLNEAIAVFRATLPLLHGEKAATSDCPIQFWHTFCCLVAKAFPEIYTHKEKATRVLISVQIKAALAPVSLGLKYLFQPKANSPISYETWAKIPQPHTFTIESILELPYCAKTTKDALLIIEALLGAEIGSEAFVDKIQGEYLQLLIRFAESPSLMIELVAPLIERLIKEKELPLSTVISAIDQALQHIIANRCDFHAFVRIHQKLFAFLNQLQQDEKFVCYEEELLPALEHLVEVRWNIQAVFSSTNPLLEQYTLSAKPFVQVRELITKFTQAKKFTGYSWPQDGESRLTLLYMELIAEAIKKIKQLRKPGIDLQRWHEMVFKKNELVVELIRLLYSLNLSFSQEWISKNITPLTNANVSRLNNELIIYKQGELLLVGRRDNVEVLEPPQKKAPKKIPMYLPVKPGIPYGTIVRRLFVKKLPSSPLTQVVDSNPSS